MTALFDSLILLAAIAPRVSWLTLAMVGVAAGAWSWWCDREGAR